MNDEGEVPIRYVYLIKMGRYHKIGHSRNVQKRVRQLDAGPHEPKVIHQFPSSNACQVENALHRRFRKQRVRGEWFSLTIEDVKAICSVTRCDAVDDLPAELIATQAKRRTPAGCKLVAVDLPIELTESLQALADANRRPYREEMIRAIERHLEVPPRVTVTEDEEPLPAAEDIYRPKKKGRPRKEKS